MLFQEIHAYGFYALSLQEKDQTKKIRLLLRDLSWSLSSPHFPVFIVFRSVSLVFRVVIIFNSKCLKSLTIFHRKSEELHSLVPPVLIFTGSTRHSMNTKTTHPHSLHIWTDSFQEPVFRGTDSLNNAFPITTILISLSVQS